MKPLELLGETYAPDGTHITLTRHDREYIIMAAGKPLMSSRMHGSEQTLATFGCARFRSRPPPCSSAASAWVSLCAPRSTSSRPTRRWWCRS
jgi:hypothetical protein